MTHPHATLVNAFYAAFQRRDAGAMAACYHPEVTFRDAVFDLRGDEARLMWRMLCERGADLRVEFRDVSADDATGRAHWDAYYTFSVTGRRVHNSIDATFRFRDGKIAEHVDTFGFHRWARQALGPAGLLLGWTPFFRNVVRRNALKGLRAYAVKQAA
ncbi:MAG: nuclear transport factor 2 family protein [Deltaproteobacteria bacterium]|nr:nuclear transport factor 2 family protein [Deltaproteobacteria bacterium]